MVCCDEPVGTSSGNFYQIFFLVLLIHQILVDLDEVNAGSFFELNLGVEYFIVQG